MNDHPHSSSNFLPAEFLKSIGRIKWEETEVGSPEHWTGVLRTAVTMVLHSPVPMLLFWGEQMLCFCNEASQKKLFGEGRRSGEFVLTRSEVAGIEALKEIDRRARAIINGQHTSEVHEHNITNERNGSKSEARWSCGYSAVTDELGVVQGALIVCKEEHSPRLNYTTALITAQNNAIPGALLIVDTKGKMLSFNKRFGEIWRMPQEVIDAKDDTAALRFAMSQVIDPEAFISRVNYLYEHRLPSAKEELSLKDGRVLERYGNPIIGEDGTFFGWAWYFQDITEQKYSETALRQSEQRFQAAVRAVEGYIWTNNAEGQMIGEQPGWASLTGQTFDQYQGYGWASAVHPEDAQPTIDAWNEAVRERKTFVFEHRLRLRNGGWGRFTIRAIPLVNNDGTVREWVGVHTDVTVQRKTEEALRESEYRFRTMADTAPAFIFIGNRDAEVEYVNHTWREFVGMDSETALGHGWAKATHPDDVEVSFSTYNRAFGARQPYEYEIRQLSAKDGTYHWILWKGVPRFLPNGEFLGILGIGFDITDQKKAEQELAYQKTVLETVTDNTDLALFMMDDTQKCVYMNEAAERMTGFRLEEVKGRQLHYYVHHTHPDGRHYPLEDCPIDQALPTRRRMKGEEVFVHKDGSFYPVAFTASPIIINGKATGTVIEVRNTTDDIARDKALRDNEFRFRSLANAVPQLVWIAETSGEVTYYNEQVAKFSGARKLENGSWEWQGLVHPDDQQATEDAWKRAIATGETYEMEHRVQMQDGTYRWHLSRAYPHADQTGAIVKWYGSATDVHEQKTFTENLEKLVAERTRELQRSNEDLQQFAHVASHDLKEPVRKIRTFSNRLRDEFRNEIPQKAELYLSKIEKSADRMYDMIDGVLLYSSVEAIRHASERVDVNEIIESIQSDLEVVFAKKEASIQVAPLPAVEGIPVLLHQMFYNLLNNALKFSSSERKPLIKITSSACGPRQLEALNLNHSRSYVQFRLEDNGIGFSTNDADHIFQTFTRLNSKDKYEGTGLGLALCRKIAERHGGTIWAEGSPGVGAVFNVVLPSF